MPTLPVTSDDLNLLECGCNIKEALVEEIYVKLRLIEKDIAEKRKKEGSGWKALGRPEKEKILKLLEFLRLSIDNLLELVQD